MKSILQSIADSKRDDVLPLQGKSWKEWACADKEIYRVTQKGNLTVEKYVEKVKHKKAVIRREQLQQLQRLTPLIDTFISSLRKLQGSDNFMKRNYFLQFLKLELNYISLISISEKQHRYEFIRNKLLKLEAGSQLQNRTTTKKEYDECKKQLVVLQKDIIESSFGLEHLLRELSQIYESAKVSPGYSRYFADLPMIAAELLIDGYPLELMDGDASHVPLQWVLDVLEEAKKRLENPRIFVFSVLGIQST